MTEEELKAIAERCERDDEKWGGVGLSYPDVFQMMGDRRHLLTEVERLREAQRWIPVSERTPDPTSKESIVLATMWDSVFPGCYDNGGWYSGSARIADVTHWMPLPQPPEVQP